VVFWEDIIRDQWIAVCKATEYAVVQAKKEYLSTPIRALIKDSSIQQRAFELAIASQIYSSGRCMYVPYRNL
jgi:hypothetical protein